MRGGRRYLSMGLGSLALVLLGFVVAVAARSRPGGADEGLLNLEMDLGLDVTRILAWVIVVLAVLGAALLVLGLKEAKPREDKRKRNWWAIALGILVFFVVLRYVRPLAEGLFDPPQAEAAAESTTEDLTGPASGSSAWLFSILIAAIFVAALTRVGLTVRSTDGAFDLPEPVSPPPPPTDGGRRPVAVALGTDPHARVIRAYADFETVSTSAGVGRRLAETARRHGRRVTRELDVSGSDVAALIAIFSSTRFGVGEVTPADAESAELLASKLRQEIES